MEKRFLPVVGKLVRAKLSLSAIPPAGFDFLNREKDSGWGFFIRICGIVGGKPPDFPGFVHIPFHVLFLSHISKTRVSHAFHTPYCYCGK
ncbi:MAG: hypothetical protein LLF96_05400 [Eubacteriales bacterium]|nr:hypothetical protein [Eubacteriales bacterium]